ncbi:MAG: MMPL family transporter [Deltaproteobacteria bacterium]|nr:MMPL family transporter [Deltaproteobacteria bacterium]
MGRIYHLIVEKPKTVLLLLLLLTSLLSAYAVHIRIDSSAEHLLATDDPNKKYYDDVRAIFGNDDIGVIGLVTDNVYTPSTLEKIRRITALIEKIDGVQSVRSLTNLPDPIADLSYPPPLIPKIPTTPEVLSALRRKIEEDYPVYLNLVSKDAKGAAIIITFKSLSDDEFLQKGIDEKIQEIIDHEQGPEQLYLTGMQHIKVSSLRLMQQDLRTFPPLSLLVIIGVLGVCFRNVRGVLLPILSVLCGVAWTLGIMVLLDSPMTIGTLVLPSLLIVIGSTYSIYVIAQYEEEAEKGGTAKEVVLRSLNRVSLPVTVAALTTVVGFVALLVNRIGTIRALGLYAAVGFASITIIVLTLIPATLALLPLPRHKKVTGEGKRLTALLRLVGRFNRRYQRPIIITAMLLVIPCVWGMSRIRADSNFLQFFKPDSPVRRANEIISEKIGGAQIFSIIVNSSEKGSVARWDVLKQIKELQRYLATLPGVDQTIALTDYCEIIDRAIRKSPETEGDIVVPEEENSTPPTDAKANTPDAPFWEQEERFNAVMRLVKNANPKTFAAYVDKDFSIASITVRTRLTSSSDIVRTAENIRQYAREHFSPQIEVRPTGSLILLNEATEDIVWGQVKSLGLALVVIFVVLSLMFLSMKVGFLSLLPNLLAILIFFGALGWTGVTLNLGTSIIASIAIGIAVEDAIRYLARLSAEIQATHDQELAIFQTVATVGKPIIYASAALGLGVLTLLFSNFVPIQKFGTLTAITIAAAFVNDLVLLPALLATTRIITFWDVIALKLGEDPQRTIPMFAGLRPSQAKIVTLMGELKTFPRGGPIIQEGEIGNEMYVLIKGTANVFINSATQRRMVRMLKRGDVFGEMGLIRHHERTADVVANEDVEVIAVNENFLDRMQRRYPRIGAKIFLNIAKILSDRLQDSQEAK